MSSESMMMAVVVAAAFALARHSHAEKALLNAAQT
jgi:hypothetical protein